MSPILSFTFVALLVSPRDITIFEQPNKPIGLKLHQRLVFSVYGNPSTGANWTVRSAGSPGLRFLGTKTRLPVVENPPITGQGATYLFIFEAAHKGQYKVNLDYGRSWELKKKATPWETRSAIVIIK
jgi:predicted secreted protein